MAEADIGWMMGLAIMFGLSFFFTYITYKDIESFFIFLTVFCGFAVWGGLLPLWVLVVCMILLTLIMANTINRNRRGIE